MWAIQFVDRVDGESKYILSNRFWVYHIEFARRFKCRPDADRFFASSMFAGSDYALVLTEPSLKLKQMKCEKAL